MVSRCYAVIVNDLCIARIGMIVEVSKDSFDCNDKYVVLVGDEWAHMIRRDCIRIISEDEYKLYKQKSDMIRKFIEEIDS
jgi:hypothetical protein